MTLKCRPLSITLGGTHLLRAMTVHLTSETQTGWALRPLCDTEGTYYPAANDDPVTCEVCIKIEANNINRRRSRYYEARLRTYVLWLTKTLLVPGAVNTHSGGQPNSECDNRQEAVKR